MSANRLAALLVTVLVLAASSLAQNNEISGTLGRIFVSSQDIQGAQFPNPHVHFGDGLSFSLNYGRLITRRGIFGFTGEVPFAANFDTDLNSGTNQVPEGYRAFFIAPSGRLNLFSGSAVSPWVSAGGGYGLFKMSGHAVYYGPNPGPTRTNTGVVQFGAGLDVWPWRHWGMRMEARDFWSGVPELNVDTGRSRQHNYYVGGGVIRRF